VWWWPTGTGWDQARILWAKYATIGGIEQKTTIIENYLISGKIRIQHFTLAKFLAFLKNEQSKLLRVVNRLKIPKNTVLF
jgi:hypothetical protein